MNSYVNIYCIMKEYLTENRKNLRNLLEMSNTRISQRDLRLYIH